MRFTANQVLVLVGMVIVGVQVPMYVLASNINNDEYEKSAFGTLVGALITGGFGVVMFIVKGRFEAKQAAQKGRSDGQ